MHTKPDNLAAIRIRPGAVWQELLAAVVGGRGE